MIFKNDKSSFKIHAKYPSMNEYISSLFCLRGETQINTTKLCERKNTKGDRMGGNTQNQQQKHACGGAGWWIYIYT